jgi:hypothetical protein
MDLPAQLLDAVKDNVVVQWCMVATVIVLLTSKVAAKLKGPIGAVARWAQGLGEKRVNREAEERRQARQALLRDAREGRQWAEQEIAALNHRIEDLASTLESFERLIRAHLGWDYDRVHQLVNLGVRPGDIPTPPPLRVPWRTERTDTRERQAINGHVQGPRTDETVVRASE